MDAKGLESSGQLRSVIVVMRHGDRKPKEKLKFRTYHPLFLQYIYQVRVLVSKQMTLSRRCRRALP